MTDADLEPYARRLCEIRGVDPEADGYIYKMFPDGSTYCKRMWESFVPDLRAHLEREQAITDVDRDFYENEYPKEGA